jgi:hypothetical protein
MAEEDLTHLEKLLSEEVFLLCPTWQMIIKRSTTLIMVRWSQLKELAVER